MQSNVDQLLLKLFTQPLHTRKHLSFKYSSVSACCLVGLKQGNSTENVRFCLVLEQFSKNFVLCLHFDLVTTEISLFVEKGIHTTKDNVLESLY